MILSKKLLFFASISLTSINPCMAAKPNVKTASEVDVSNPWTSRFTVASNPDLATNRELLIKLNALAKQEKLPFKVKTLLSYAMLNPNHEVTQLHLDNIPPGKIKKHLIVGMVADAARNKNPQVAAAVLKKAHDASILNDILSGLDFYVLRVVFTDIEPHPFAMVFGKRKSTTPEVRKLFNEAITTSKIALPQPLLAIIAQANKEDNAQ